MKFTNETKADIFFKAAMEELDLHYCEYGKFGNDAKRQQVRPVVESVKVGSSPFICDGLWNVVADMFPHDDADSLAVQLRSEMDDFGMPQKEFGVWDHIPAEERQEARWFFLMLMVEYMDDADNS